MAKDKVYITLEVTDKGTAVVKGFDKNTEQAFNKMKTHAKASTASMGSSLQKLKKHWVAYSVGAVAAVVAVKAVMTKIISTITTWTRLSMVQEDAEIALAASLKANLEYTDQLNTKYQEFAANIQKKTKYGDEEVLQLMALQKNLGVASDKIEEATKMSIGLAAATGRDVQSMAMYVALAQQGEFTMLRRYIPALRSTTDATEQLRIVMEFAARGFKVAQDVTESFSGSLKQTSNLWGDLREKLASVITKNQTILAYMKQTREWLIKVGEEVDAWREANQAFIDQKAEKAIEAIKEAIVTLAPLVQAIGVSIGWLAKQTMAFIDDFVKLGKWIGETSAKIVLHFENTKGATAEEANAMFSLEGGAKHLNKELQNIIASNIALFSSMKNVSSQKNYLSKGEPTVKPELPLLEDATPKITAPEFAGDYWLNLKESSEQALNEETERMNKRIAFEQETDDMLLEMKAQYYLDDKALAEQRLIDEIAMMNGAAKKEKNIEDAKARVEKQAAIAMLANWNSAFAELAKGSKTAFALWKATALAQTIIDTYAAAQAAYKAMAGIPVVGPALGVAAAAAAIAAGMARVSAIQGQEMAEMYHAGGIVGRGVQSSRLVSPDVFAGAQRAHTGLGPDEKPVIVKNDEGIFTKEQMAAMGTGLGLEGRIDNHVHVYLDGREITKAQLKLLEKDGMMVGRFQRALS